MTITGTADRDSDKSAAVTFTITLINPCESPVITVPEFENQLYKLTADLLPYTHPVFTIVPDFCTITYQYDVTPLAAGDSAITNPTGDDKTFNFFYNSDDAPINLV